MNNYNNNGISKSFLSPSPLLSYGGPRGLINSANLRDVKTKSFIQKLPNEVTLERNTTHKTEIKMPKGRGRNVSIVAFLIPTGKGNTGQVILKVIKSHDVI